MCAEIARGPRQPGNVAVEPVEHHRQKNQPAAQHHRFGVAGHVRQQGLLHRLLDPRRHDDRKKTANQVSQRQQGRKDGDRANGTHGWGKLSVVSCQWPGSRVIGWRAVVYQSTEYGSTEVRKYGAPNGRGVDRTESSALRTSSSVLFPPSTPRTSCSALRTPYFVLHVLCSVLSTAYFSLTLPHSPLLPQCLTPGP